MSPENFLADSDSLAQNDKCAIRSSGGRTERTAGAKENSEDRNAKLLKKK